MCLVFQARHNLDLHTSSVHIHDVDAVVLGGLLAKGKEKLSLRGASYAVVRGPGQAFGQHCSWSASRTHCSSTNIG